MYFIWLQFRLFVFTSVVVHHARGKTKNVIIFSWFKAANSIDAFVFCHSYDSGQLYPIREWLFVFATRFDTEDNLPIFT